MSILENWSSKLKITNAQLKELEASYKGKTKGSMYQKRKVQLEASLRFIRGKVKTLGTEGSIIKCTFNLGVKKQTMFFINITAEDGKMLVKLRIPEAEDIIAENIFPGIPSTEK